MSTTDGTVVPVSACSSRVSARSPRSPVVSIDILSQVCIHWRLVTLFVYRYKTRGVPLALCACAAWELYVQVSSHSLLPFTDPQFETPQPAHGTVRCDQRVTHDCGSCTIVATSFTHFSTLDQSQIDAQVATQKLSHTEQLC